MSPLVQRIRRVKMYNTWKLILISQSAFDFRMTGASIVKGYLNGKVFKL